MIYTAKIPPSAVKAAKARDSLDTIIEMLEDYRNLDNEDFKYIVETLKFMR